MRKTKGATSRKGPVRRRAWDVRQDGLDLFAEEAQAALFFEFAEGRVWSGSGVGGVAASAGEGPVARPGVAFAFGAANEEHRFLGVDDGHGGVGLRHRLYCSKPELYVPFGNAAVSKGVKMPLCGGYFVLDRRYIRSYNSNLELL